MAGKIRIGVDVDNTIIDYSRLFFEVGLSRGLHSESRSATKEKLKSTIIRKYGEEAWTRLQGEVYATTPSKSDLFPGVEGVLNEWAQLGYQVDFMSHKTRYPVIGQRIDLRKVTESFLRSSIQVEFTGANFGIHFFESQKDKIRGIASRDFDFFIDDLIPIVLAVPENCRAIHFMCGCSPAPVKGHIPCSNWTEVGLAIGRV